MSNQYLKLRRSNVPGKIPTTESIDFGEIALNTYDGLAYMKINGPNGIEVVPIASSSGSFSGNFTGTFSGSLFGTASWAEKATTASYYNETDPIFVAKSASFATTGSNTFIGNQTISGSLGIGTTTPSTIFDVRATNSSSFIFNPTDQGGRITLTSATASVPLIQVIIPASGSRPLAGIQMGMNTWDTVSNTFGNSGDGF